MGRIDDIISIVDCDSPGLLEEIAHGDSITKEELVRKILALSHGRMVCTHQGGAARGRTATGGPAKAGGENGKSSA